jgi:CRISPR-associated protein Csx14
LLLPVRLENAGQTLEIGHWADASSRNTFKLYAGNRAASQIVSGMLRGTRKKTRGVTRLWEIEREALIAAPFDVLPPMGGSFNFDPRGAWCAIDAGYSPNKQKDAVAASPVVEILAAIGLEHARPDVSEHRTVRYSVWAEALTPAFARIAIADIDLKLPRRRFRFELTKSGRNKVVTFATEEIDRDPSFE